MEVRVVKSGRKRGHAVQGHVSGLSSSSRRLICSVLDVLCLGRSGDAQVGITAGKEKKMSAV